MEDEDEQSEDDESIGKFDEADAEEEMEEEIYSEDEQKSDDEADDIDQRKPKKAVSNKSKRGEEKELNMLYEDPDYQIFGGEVNDDEMQRDMEQSKITKKDMKRINRIKAYEKMEQEQLNGGPIVQDEAEDDIEEIDNSHLDELTLNQKKLLDRRNKKEQKRMRGQVNDSTIQVVPSKRFEDFDPDELAADLALAKKMIRKKDREEILDMSFNKYNNFDYEGLPNWFVDDEKKHNFVNLPITKEEVKAMRDELRALNEKPAKKVLEARFRKKRKLEKQLRKFKKEADQVFEEEGLDDRTKSKEVSKLRNKIVTADKNKRGKKKIIVGKKFKITAPGKKTTGRKYKIVDRRSKKEVRAEKRRMRGGGKKKGKRY